MKVSEYPGGLPTPKLDGVEVVARYSPNANGRDFIVGDIHGMFSHFRALLDEVDFDTTKDRVFSVGDLVDRGPESAQALDWLAKPWFFCCRGNHEQFAIDSVDPEQLELWVGQNGGEWWLELDVLQREEFRNQFYQLPLAIEVETAHGIVGIVHADVPPLLSWNQFMDLLEARDRNAAFYAMWSRNRIQGHRTTLPVEGTVVRIYCGHTPTRRTVKLDNVYYIDTGAVYIQDGYDQAMLTMVEIQPEEHQEYAISTALPV